MEVKSKKKPCLRHVMQMFPFLFIIIIIIILFYRTTNKTRCIQRLEKNKLKNKQT